MTMHGNLAEFRDVVKTYRNPLDRGGPIHALRGVSLEVRPGEVLALLGPNRAGKTTLLKVLLGLCRPSGGRVLRFGLPTKRKETLGRVGYLHENQVFPRYMTAAGVLEFYGRLSRLSASVLKARVPDLLGRVGLADRAHEPIRRFSKGMGQRLALAQALITEPDLLVLDEPTEGLDLGARQVLHDAIAKHRREGRSVLLVSHALGEVARICDRVAVLADGQIRHEGTLSTLLAGAGPRDHQSLEDALSAIYRA